MNGFTLIFLLAIILVAFYSISSWSGNLSNENPPREKGIKVTDIRGMAVQLPEPAKRIVVLYQGSLDGLYMLGAEDKIVGIQHNIYTNPESFKYFGKLDPRIANKELAAPGNWENSTNLESVVSLRPDLVIMPSSQTSAISVLESINIPVFAVSPSNNEQLFEEILALGFLTGTQHRAIQLIDYTKSKLEEIKSSTSYQAKRKKVYYAWSGGRIYSTSGRNSRMHECFELAGVENACPFEVDTPNISPESLIAWDPDLFLLWNSDPKSLYERKELQVLRAVQEKKVHVFEPAFFYDPHTLKMMYMAMELHKVAYEDQNTFDLLEDRKEIMHKLYGEKAENLF